MRVGVLNLGLGNVKSLFKICNRFVDPELVGPNDSWEKFDFIIFPGVGSFDAVMEVIFKYKVHNKLNNFLDSGKPFMGICVGMQVLFEASEEGASKGLSRFPGKLYKFNDSNVVVPHMTWDNVRNNNFSFPTGNKFYFTHSYYMPLNGTFESYLSCQYDRSFLAGFIDNNIIGVQFHPEKSGSYGIKFFENLFEYIRGFYEKNNTDSTDTK